MKALSIIGIIASLGLMVAGFVVSQITCFTIGTGYGNFQSVPDDADGWGMSIIGIGVFFMIYSIIGFRKK